tara:strand:+ start:609 stop:2768 length:2160 start_codon:yes stop_codon:yes gene_type:complete
MSEHHESDKLLRGNLIVEGGLKVNGEELDTIIANGGSGGGVTGSNVSSLSSVWEDTYTTVAANSATWGIDTGSDVSSLSSVWEDTYTTVQANSAAWGTGGSGGTSSNVQATADQTTTVTGTDILEFSLDTSNTYLISHTLTGSATSAELRVSSTAEGPFTIVLLKGPSDSYSVALQSTWNVTSGAVAELNKADREIIITGVADGSGNAYVQIVARNSFDISSVTWNNDFIIFGSDQGEEDDANHDSVAAAMVSRGATEIYHAGDTYPSGGWTPAVEGYDAFSSYIDQQKWFHTHGNHDYDFIADKGDLQGTVGSVLLASGAGTWDYLELENTAADFPVGWNTNSGGVDGFTAGGITPFGYGESTTPGTTLDFGGDANNKRITYLMRTQIAQASIASTGVVMEFTFDDAMIIFVNGVEVASYNAAYPVTRTSGSLATVSGTIPSSQGLTFGERNNSKRMIVLDAALFNQTTNTLAVMVKNQDEGSSDCWFDCDLTNYTFPSVRSFGNMAYTCEDAGMGVRAIAPYIPQSCDRYVRSVANVDYFFLGSGRNSSRDVTTGGGPTEPDSTLAGRSKGEQWLIDAVESSTAEFKFAVTHDTPHSHASGKSFDYQEYLYTTPALSGLNGMLHGDDHQTQITTKPNAGGKQFYIIGASNFRNSGRSNQGLGGTNASEWTVNYVDVTAQNNYFVELKSAPGVVKIELIDAGNADNGSNIIFTQLITN